MVETIGTSEAKQPSKKEKRMASYKGMIYGGPLVTSLNYNQFTKEQRGDANAHLKAFLKGKDTYKFGKEMIKGPNDLDFWVARVRPVRRFTRSQYVQMKADYDTRRSAEGEEE